jgi:hypothetical protein
LRREPAVQLLSTHRLQRDSGWINSSLLSHQSSRANPSLRRRTCEHRTVYTWSAGGCSRSVRVQPFRLGRHQQQGQPAPSRRLVHARQCATGEHWVAADAASPRRRCPSGACTRGCRLVTRCPAAARFGDWHDEEVTEQESPLQCLLNASSNMLKRY